MHSVIDEIRSAIRAVESDNTLLEEPNFSNRVATLDFLESDVFERIEGLLVTDDWQGKLLELRQEAEVVRAQLESVNSVLFQRLRDGIASQEYTGAKLRELIVSYAGDGQAGVGSEGYDSLDVLVNGFLLMGDAPTETRRREPEMVFYQPTPARVVLELVDRAGLEPHDVFYDIGAGLGQVAILVHLLTGVRSKGVEFEPAYCDYARGCAKKLDLSQVEFVNADAREADYSDGTAFFLYTPCEGRMLEQVLERLGEESKKREIRLYTYGPCTQQVALHSWLERVGQNSNSVYQLAVFKTSSHVSRAAR